jgi:Putative binding domain, N-terminal/Viral BACON domain
MPRARVVTLPLSLLLVFACSDSPSPSTPSPSCTYSVSASGSEFGPAGGTGTLTVSAPTGCRWTASSQAEWIAVQGSASGSGNGTVSMTIAAYDGSEPRSGSVTVAEQRVSISQSACSLRLSPENRAFSDQGGSGEIDLAIQPGCRWRAGETPQWVTITPSDGIGPATLRVTVAENNTGLRRDAMVRLGATALTIAQGGESCRYAVASDRSEFAFAGGDGIVEVKTAAGCRWEIKTDVDWLRVQDESTGTGPARLRFSVGVNTRSEDRLGHVALNGESIDITQSGQRHCSGAVTPVQTFARRIGNRAEFTVNAEAGCAWTANVGAGWLRILEGTRGVGRGRVVYQVDRNPEENAHDFRKAPIEVRWAGPSAGENMWVWQFPGCAAGLAATGVIRHANDEYSYAAAATGADLSILVLVDLPFSCPWTVVPTDESWIAVRRYREPEFRRGDADALISIAPNPSRTSRTTRVLIAERTLTITQTGR